jgi:2-polyprenyl-6-methoxyphenol hydroxylase-like FAD-dependent oxidoreductase/predicted DsbA family dithiol-disulfide isomerase
MKVVIIGGGIAGLTFGRFLLKKNIDVVINERAVGAPILGHAFLMHTDGLSILKELGEGSKSYLPGKKVQAFCLKRPDGKDIKRLQLDTWMCLKRKDLISFLLSLIPPSKIKGGRAFSHFIYENEKIVAAAFLNGEVEYGDLFVGADGGNSKVRELIQGKVQLSAVEVKEVVGICYNNNIAPEYSNFFTKFQKKECGLAFGIIPTAPNEYVWFLQFDPRIRDVPEASAEDLKVFCKAMMADFPQVVQDVLDSNDFFSTYVWNTRDFDLLPSFHKKNVVLIGDAAHLALPFTSAGTTNAILDAKTVSSCLETYPDMEEAFTKYYETRSYLVSQHILLGRELKKIFLKPLENDDNIPVPLIAEEKDLSGVRKNKPIQVLYFTDPICSTCWIIQPLLRKLKLEYDQYVNIEYKMGGLLPNWEKFNRGGIAKPTDAAQHWEEVCAVHEMPLDGDVWIEDPLPSSYPPSIAFKAAQMQNNDKAILFLRRIKEMVFLEKKNIIKWEFLEKSAFDVGLDSARLLRDFEGKAKDLFKEDLLLAKKLDVTAFPTLFFSNADQNQEMIRGYQSYEKFEDIIQKLIPGAQKAKINKDPRNLFTHFNRMTEKEFAFLSDISKEESKRILNELFDEGSIDKYESKNGVIYISNFITNEKAFA